MVATVVTGEQVADFLGRGGDLKLIALARIHVGIVTELAKAYTRGKGFDEHGQPNMEIAGVITMATARLVINPEQNKREQFGEYTVTPGTLYGWTLVEIQTLNRYRVRNSSGAKRTVPEWPAVEFPDVLDGGDA